MTRRPLLNASSVRASASRAAFGVLALAGALLSGCSDAGSSANTAASDVADAASEAVVSSVANSAPAPATSFASAWGPGVGSTIPMLAAIDQAGSAQDLASLTGEKGLLLVFSRSADW